MAWTGVHVLWPFEETFPTHQRCNVSTLLKESRQKHRRAQSCPEDRASGRVQTPLLRLIRLGMPLFTLCLLVKHREPLALLVLNHLS